MTRVDPSSNRHACKHRPDDIDVSNLTSSSTAAIEQDVMASASASKSEIPASNASLDLPAAQAPATRPKRVRTGCLTCRERHLKCDEGLPDCTNCQKSGRLCKRGVRLNFIDTTVRTPPITPPSEDWDISFRDESREIASEYKGGAKRYMAVTGETEIKQDRDYSFASSVINAPVLSHPQLPAPPNPAPQPFTANSVEMFSNNLPLTDANRDPHHRHSSTVSDSTFSSNTITYTNGDQTLTPPCETRDMLTNPEELLFMQVFVEEVAIWMDSMDPYKHVRISAEWPRLY